tara:strand:- start:76 stop:288 length:213 start_codon:yes stop_codon:yes gene_type:complete
MSDDFKKYIKDFEKSPKGSERKKQKDQTRFTLVAILAGGFIISVIFPPLFVLWGLYLIFIFFYASREWIG